MEASVSWFIRMRSQAVRQAFSRRIRVLDRDLPGVLEHDVEALHRTRVASRRIREALPVIGTDGGEVFERDLRKGRNAVRHLTRALGRVRELDVAAAILGEFAARDPDLSPAIAAVSAIVERDLTARREQMVRRLDEIKPGRLARRLSSIVERAAGETSPDRASQLRRRVARRVDRLEAAVESAGALYAFDRLHLVRIAAKKLRYGLELVQELTGVRTRRLVNRLKAVQDLLGRLHDLEIVAGYVRRAASDAPAGLDAPLGSLLEQIDREIREQHSRYLGRTRALGDVIATCRGELEHRLTAAAAPRALAG